MCVFELKPMMRDDSRVWESDFCQLILQLKMVSHRPLDAGFQIV